MPLNKTWISHIGEEVFLPEINSNKFSIGYRSRDQFINIAVEINGFKYMIQMGYSQDGFELMLIPVNINNWNHVEDIDSNFNADGKNISLFALKFIKDNVIPKLREK